MSAYGLSGYLAKAHQAHLMREANMARGAQSRALGHNAPSGAQRLLGWCSRLRGKR
jgi:hypothetical protein